MKTDTIDPEFREQVTLFDNVERKIFSRRTDSPTSTQAVKLPRIKGELSILLKAIEKMVVSFTARELAAHSGLDYYMIQKRLSVLKRLDFVIKSDPNDPQFAQRNGQAVWRRTQKEAIYL